MSVSLLALFFSGCGVAFQELIEVNKTVIPYDKTFPLECERRSNGRNAKASQNVSTRVEHTTHHKHSLKYQIMRTRDEYWVSFQNG